MDAIEEEKALLSWSRDPSPPAARKQLGNSSLCTIVHVVMVLMEVAVGVLLLYHSNYRSATALAPLKDIRIEYQPSPYADFELSDFAGLPSPGVDAAWHDLLEGIAIRVTHDELLASNQTSVALPNGGFMAWLGVSHELHCIKMLRQWNYRGYYYPNISEQDSIREDVHADHCLEVLRSAAMCHGDTTLTTFRWDVKEKPMLNTKLVPHKCVDWDQMTSSTAQRKVAPEEVASMINPLLHPIA